MPATSRTSSAIVIDASLAIWAVLPIVSAVDTLDLIAQWRLADIRLVTPMLWLAECASAIRGVVQSGSISIDEGHRALEDVLALEVDSLPMTPAQTRVAFEWADRLGQRRAYDGFYLALAEEIGAEFWSADRRLVNGTRRLGASWVHLVEATVP